MKRNFLKLRGLKGFGVVSVGVWRGFGGVFGGFSRKFTNQNQKLDA
jgi:hypothetical protein